MVDAVTLGLGVIILIVFAYMVKVVLDLQSTISSSVDRMERQLGQLEQSAAQVSSDVSGLKTAMNDKVDRSFVERRLNGLSDLLRKKKR